MEQLFIRSYADFQYPRILLLMHKHITKAKSAFRTGSSFSRYDYFVDEVSFGGSNGAHNF